VLAQPLAGPARPLERQLHAAHAGSATLERERGGRASVASVPVSSAGGRGGGTASTIAGCPRATDPLVRRFAKRHELASSADELLGHRNPPLALAASKGPGRDHARVRLAERSLIPPSET
jgi:hypothetical protein